MVLKSAAEVASEAHEISHQQDSTEKKKEKIGRVKSVNIYPSKIKSKAKKEQGNNGTSILYSNRFYILSSPSILMTKKVLRKWIKKLWAKSIKD